MASARLLGVLRHVFFLLCKLFPLCLCPVSIIAMLVLSVVCCWVYICVIADYSVLQVTNRKRHFKLTTMQITINYMQLPSTIANNNNISNIQTRNVTFLQNDMIAKI